MNSKEKHIKENDPHQHHHHDEDVRSDMIADSLKAEGKDKARNSTKRINNLWLWLGVLVLILILLWWLFDLGTYIDLTGFFNGGN